MDKYIGNIFGYYKIIEKTNNKNNDGHYIYKAQCINCGKVIYSVISNMIDKKEDKCRHINNYTNTKTLLYNGDVWENKRLGNIYNLIVQGCYNKNDKNYVFYGEKGIKICDEWLQNPKEFEEWALLNGYEDYLTIDRINPEKDYSPQNCRWVTCSENSKWKSTTNVIDVDGVIDSGRGWSKRLGLGINHINRFLKNNGMKKTIEYIRNNIK